MTETNRVTMVHPVTKGRFDAPATAVKFHERAGWRVATDDPAEETIPPEPGPEAGKAVRRPATKEEGK
jgi:hypothetical protein